MFLSLKLAENLHSQNDLLDDRESSFWLLVWIVLKHMPYKYGTKPVFMNEYYDYLTKRTEYRQYACYAISERRAKLAQGKLARMELGERHALVATITELQALILNMDQHKDIPLKGQHTDPRNEGWLVAIYLKHLKDSRWPSSDVSIHFL